MNADHAISVQADIGLDDGRGYRDTTGGPLAAMGNGKSNNDLGI